MNAINESELLLIVRGKAIKTMHIDQTGEGKFRILVTLKSQEEEFELVTFRKTPREWASLDRLAKHIQQKYRGIPSIILTFYSGEATK
jgi:hypothetical protein